ncbi:hypothetical protein L842_1390 [Mycobacterium intracellulare MIN_052511_1280]|nr:hypothetical protein L842_1390 [Mycobacterium intracellulare MIN_052511_1280]
MAIAPATIIVVVIGFPGRDLVTDRNVPPLQSAVRGGRHACTSESIARRRN